MAKTPTKRTPRTKERTQRELNEAAVQFAHRTSRPTKAAEAKAELQAAQNAAATTMDPQTGMDVVHAEKPSKAQIEARKNEVDQQFAEADAKGKAGPSPEQIAETSLSRSIRGW